MSFEEFLLVIKARSRVIFLTLMCTVVIIVGTSLILPKSYKATASLVLNYKGVDPVSGIAIPPQLMPGYMATQVDIITSKNVATRVVSRLKLNESDSAKTQFMEDTEGKGDLDDWLASLLLKKLDVLPSKDSSVVTINFKNPSPEFAAAVANSFATEYQQASIELMADPLKKASAYFVEQTRALRADMELAQNKLSKYQQENGIVSIDNRMDVESGRLNDLSSQLVAVQGQLMEATSRRQQIQMTGANDSPDVINNPLIQNLRASLAQAEAKFSEASERYGKNHPIYQSAKAEIDMLRSELRKNIETTSSSIKNSARILEHREADVRYALAAQKARVLDLNRKRDELSVLSKDVESAQRAYDGVMQRFNQTNIEAKANQTDVAVLSRALPPVEPSFPKIFINAIVSIFLGTTLGIGMALLSEIIDPRVRSEASLGKALQAVVFITTKPIKSEVRRSILLNLFRPRQSA